MSVEQDLTQAAAPSTEAGAATTPTISTPSAPEAEAPAIRVGNSGAHIARASQEIEKQLRAAEAGQQPGSSAEPESADDTSGATTGGQPVTQVAATPTDELSTLRQRLEQLEKERQTELETRRAAELQSLNEQQRRDFEELQNDVEAANRKAARDQKRLDDLAREYQTAVAERDIETIQAITEAYAEQQQDLAISQRAAWRLQQQQLQFKAYADQQYHQAHIREQAAQIGRIASQYGLTPDDIKSVKADLDVTKPFEVLDVVTKALHKKLSATVDTTKQESRDQATKIRQEILNEFDNSPGAQPHPGGSTNTATGASLGIRVGNSKALIERAFKSQR